MSLGYLPALDPALFAGLADGPGAADAVDHLAATRRMLHTARLELVRRLTEERHPSAYTGVADALALLSAADKADSTATGWVAGSPQFGAWSARCAALLCQTDAAPAELADALAHLTAIAAAAALRARLTFQVTVPVRAGSIALPTVGYVSAGSGSGTATLTRSSAGATVHTTEACVDLVDTDPRWRPLRRITAVADGLTLDVHVDPADPYLFPDWGVPGAWNHDAFAAQVAEAWRILVARHRPYAVGIGRALTHLVPLAPRPAGGSASATDKDGFGAVALTMPPDATACAVTLLHEVQHLKLNGVFDIVDLNVGGGWVLHRAPWRADARPVAGLLHGTYAFAGVADFWRVERSVDPNDRADLEFCQWRGAVRLAADALLNSGELTDAGVAFVSRIARQAREWEYERVPAAVTELAQDAEQDRLAVWRLRNHSVPLDAVAALAAAYVTGNPPPVIVSAFDVRGGPPDGGDDERQRLRLQRHRVADSAGSAADRAYLDGRAEAVDLYLAELRMDADRIPAWAGLALALLRGGDPTVHEQLEMTAAVCRALRAKGVVADPRAVARWLAAAPAFQIAGSSMSNSER